ncbi:MAG: protease complex subunit PrcB family protein, partial [bacterium]
CAAARRELDEYRTGSRQALPNPPALPALPWDQKILAWITRQGDPPASLPGPEVKTIPMPPQDLSAEKKKIGILGMLTMFILVVPVTPLLLLVPRQIWEPVLRLPLVQTEISSVKALVVEARTGWLHESPDQAGWKPSLAPHWQGENGPVVEAQQDCVTVEQDFSAYWQLLEPNSPEPDINFDRDAVAILFQGQKKSTGYGIQLEKINDAGVSTVLVYQEKEPGAFSMTQPHATRPWSMMVIPRPAHQVFFQKD